MKKTTNSWRPWKNSELQYLRQNLALSTCEQCASHLLRTTRAVMKMAKKQGIPARHPGRPKIYELY